MNEEKKIKVDSLPEKKIRRKDTELKDIPKIETLEHKIDISYIKTENPFQIGFDIIVLIGSFYGFIQICYFLLTFLSNIISDFIIFIIPF